MKKILLNLMIGLMVLFGNAAVVEANGETPEVEVIEDEQTPEAGGVRQSYTMQLVFLVVAVGCGAVLYLVWNKNQLQLYVSSVHDNHDGSYTVGWGYKNSRHSSLSFNKNETGFRVKKGSAIYLKKDDDLSFHHGTHNDCFMTVVNEDTEIEWFAGEKKVQLDSQLLDKYIKGEGESKS